MYFGNVVNLLQAIGSDRDVRTKVSHSYDPNHGEEWTAMASSSEGETWISRHGNLLLAVVMLERILKEQRRGVATASRI